MSVEIDSLYWKAKIDYDGLKADIDKINSKISGMSDTTSKETSKIEGYFKKAFGVLATIGIAAMITTIGNKIIETTSQFEKFDAVLTNSFGNASQAQAALNNIQDFASNTPYQVTELTDSFIKLRNQGFTPTMAEMTKMGDLAASTGKSFGDLTEGILDASMGEWERMKEFGIKAKQEGDKVTIMFKGQKETIDNNAESVRNYIVGLGSLKGVTGTMSSISATIGGQISNLQDSVDAMYNNIGKANRGIITQGVSGLKSLVDAANEYFKNVAWQKGLDEMAKVSKANKDQADTATTLLTRYKELTKDGLTPTAEKKKELAMILTSLKDMFGKNVLEIDKETGAYKLNTDEVNRNIQSKLNAADENKLKLAGEIRAANQLNELKKEEREAAQRDLDAYNAILREKAGLIYDNSRLLTTTDYNKRNEKKSPDDLAEIRRVTQLAWLKVDQLKALNSVIGEQSEKVTDGMKAFKKAGYTESDYYNLTKAGKVSDGNTDYTSGNAAAEAARKAAEASEKAKKEAAKQALADEKEWNKEAKKNEKEHYDALLKTVKDFNKNIAEAEADKYKTRQEQTKQAFLSRGAVAAKEMEQANDIYKQYRTKEQKLLDLEKEYNEKKRLLAIGGGTAEQRKILEKEFKDKIAEIITDDDIERLKKYRNALSDLGEGLRTLADATGSKILGSVSSLTGQLDGVISKFETYKSVANNANSSALETFTAGFGAISAAVPVAMTVVSLMQQIFSAPVGKSSWEILAEDMKKANDELERNQKLQTLLKGKDNADIQSSNIRDTNKAIMEIIKANEFVKSGGARSRMGGYSTETNGYFNVKDFEGKSYDEMAKAYYDVEKNYKSAIESIAKEKGDVSSAKLAYENFLDKTNGLVEWLDKKRQLEATARSQELEADKTLTEKALINVKEGSAEELKLKLELAEQQRIIDVNSVEASSDSEKLRVAKIEQINAESAKNLDNLRKEYREKEKAAQKERNAIRDAWQQDWLGGTAETLADGIKKGLAEGKTFMEAFTGETEDLIKNALLKGFEVSAIQPQMQIITNGIQKLYRDMENATQGHMTAADYQDFVDEATKKYGKDSDAVKNMQNAYNAISSVVSGISTSDTSSSSSSKSSGAMTGASEQTVSLLNGQFNAMRIDLKEQVSIATQGIKHLANIDKYTSVLPEMYEIMKNSGRSVGL